MIERINESIIQSINFMMLHCLTIEKDCGCVQLWQSKSRIQFACRCLHLAALGDVTSHDTTSALNRTRWKGKNKMTLFQTTGVRCFLKRHCSLVKNSSWSAVCKNECIRHSRRNDIRTLITLKIHQPQVVLRCPCMVRLYYYPLGYD